MDDNKLGELKGELTCPICFNYFTQPKTLPCLHTFCEKCIGEHMEKTQENGVFRCPMCNGNNKVPVDGVKGLKDNLFVINLVALVPDGPTRFCDPCKHDGSDIQADSTCLHCGENLCHECSAVHKKTKLTREHQILPYDEASGGQYFEEIRSYQKNYCRAHPHEIVKIFCDSCEIPVCLLCNAVEHESHKMSELTDAAKNVDEIIKHLLESVRNNLQIIEKIGAKVLAWNEEAMRDQTKAVNEVVAIFDKLQTMLNAKKEGLIAKIRNESKPVEQQLADKAHEIERHQANLECGIQYGDRLIENGNQTEKLQQSKELIQRLQQLEETDIKLNVNKPIYTVKMLKDFEVSVTAELELIPFELKLLPHAHLVHSFSSVFKGEKEATCLGIEMIKGKYFIIDRHNSNVKVLNKYGCPECVLSRGQYKLKMPRDVKHDGEHNILVTDDGIKGIVVYDKNYNQVKVIKDVYTRRGSIACSKDMIVVADSVGGQVILMDIDGRKKKVVDEDSLGLEGFNPIYVATDHAGNIIVIDNQSKCAYIIDSTGSKVLHTYRPTGNNALMHPVRVCCDQCGHIIIADSPDGMPGCLHVISTTGKHLGIPVTKYDGLVDPTGVVVSGHGEVTVVDLTGSVKVYKYLDM